MDKIVAHIRRNVFIPVMTYTRFPRKKRKKRKKRDVSKRNKIKLVPIVDNHLVLAELIEGNG